MHSERFDGLARTFAVRGTPRQFLAATTGLAVTASTRRISPSFTPAVSAESVCAIDDSASICPDTVDDAAIATRLMRPLAVAPGAGCLPGDAPCDRDAACCSGVCTMHGHCGCFATGHLCPGDGYCCGGSCVNGRCA